VCVDRTKSLRPPPPTKTVKERMGAAVEEQGFRPGMVSVVRQSPAGATFWFMRKRFFGSYFAFTAASRAKLDP
jgi:hypothetical protein